MKILVSSKNMYNHLKRFDFKHDRIKTVMANGSEITLLGSRDSITIWCDILSFKARITQENARWDNLLSLVKNMQDQPIMITIDDGVLNVEISY